MVVLLESERSLIDMIGPACKYTLMFASQHMKSLGLCG